MNMDNILDSGLMANLLELAHRKYFVDGFEKTDMYSIVDLPQHVLVVAWASSFFYSSSALIPLLAIVPLTFKAILFCTKQGSNLNKMARAGDHIMRINAKVILMMTSISSIFAKPSFSMTQFFAAARAFTYVVYCVKDINTIFLYGLSSMDNFETAIFADYRKFLD